MPHEYVFFLCVNMPWNIYSINLIYISKEISKIIYLGIVFGSLYVRLTESGLYTSLTLSSYPSIY